jgi:hypothetical protein
MEPDPPRLGEMEAQPVLIESLRYYTSIESVLHGVQNRGGLLGHELWGRSRSRLARRWVKTRCQRDWR